MVNNYVLIGIAVGVFFAGIGIGYAIFQPYNQPNFMMMTPQQMQQMMNNPQAMNNWMNSMMQNPQMMNQWMNSMMSNPQFVQNMHDIMMQNPQHMQQMSGMMGSGMMRYMMNDPQLSQQMMNTMMQNPQFMQGMMMNPQFQQNWMDPLMMNQTNWQGMMMSQPLTKSNDVLSTINNIEDLLDQISTSYTKGDSNTAFSLATSAYLENYEYIESAIASKNRILMEKIELMLRVDLRHLIKTEAPAEDIDAKIDSIKKDLDTVKSLFK